MSFILYYTNFTTLKKNIELIEVQSDLGAATRGAGFGALALQKFGTSRQQNIFVNIPQKTSFLPLESGYSSNYARNIETIVKTCTFISNDVCRSIQRGNKPVIISGDHSNAAGTIAGIKMAKPNSVLGVVWIDAHADLHSPYTSPSGNMHGMPLAASIGDDNLKKARRDIDTLTSYYWDKFKNIGNISPKVRPSNIVYVSLRDYEKEEAHLIETYGINHINTCSLVNFGTEDVVAKIFDQLQNCTDIYVSFDVDSLDSSVSRGTGLPVKGGLMPWEAELLVSLLLKNPKVACFEITEFNTFLDLFNETAPIVYDILEKGILAMQNSHISSSLFSENSYV